MESPSVVEQELNAATAAFAGGDYERVVEIASRIIAASAPSARARALRANARLKLERWNEAIVDLDVLVADQPQNAQLRRLTALCWLRIGNAHKVAGEPLAAIDAYRRAIAAAPEQQDARHNLGMLLLSLEQAADALPLLRAVTAAEPDNAAAAIDLARALLASGARDESVHIASALAQRSPDEAVVRTCCEFLLDAGAIERAQSAIAGVARSSSSTQWQWVVQQAKRLRDNAAAEASRNVLAALGRQSLPEKARVCVDLHDALGLPSVYRDVAEIERRRSAFADALEHLAEKYPPGRIAEIAPLPDDLRWDNFLLAYQGRNDRDLQRRFGDWYSAALRVLVPVATLDSRQRRRPRIALISGRWHHSTVGVYFGAWVEHLAACGWEVILVHVGAYRDAWTERLAKAAHGELTLTGPLAHSAQRLRELDADLALYPELGMDSTVLALAALRLARVQACGWGHPSTTGLPTIDAFISCAEMEPEGAIGHYSERLLLLPGLGTRYPAASIPAAAPRASLRLPARQRLYLVPQSAFKLHPDNDALLANIVESDRDAVLVLFADREIATTAFLRERLRAELARVTERPDEHMAWLPRCTREEYLAFTRACDVMVDSLHWSGGNTTLDALHCGLPVVTCPGPLMRGRQSAAMLRALDRVDLITASPAQLAVRAVEIANDPAARERTAATQIERLPGLTQSPAPLQALDARLRALLGTMRE